MARKTRILKTIWRVPDQLWQRIALVLHELDPPARTGRPRIDPRHALDGIIYQLRTGCQWEALPKEFGDDSSVHRTMERWIDKGVFPLAWSMLVHACAELGGVNFDWQAADCAMNKARQGGIKSAAIPQIAAKMARNAA